MEKQRYSPLQSESNAINELILSTFISKVRVKLYHKWEKTLQFEVL